ncbi:MAG: alanine--tRNA ligase, partial [Lachnospiraceae bacterium]|nr:alanine--tRNA ligase [Lachnospiraceae bacterium]
GDYFKHEAIAWAWEFFTSPDWVGMDPDRLYPSVYQDDDEAWNIWHEEIGIPADRIYRFGKEDNFWEHGSGPCGPCTEIYYDRGEKWSRGPEDVMGGEGDRFMEVWNVVFSQFNNDGHGNYTELEQKNIDTGMGLERLAVAVQDVESLFDVDTIRSLRDEVCTLAGCTYGVDHETDVSVRIITDHIRSTTFMISDGIMPTNEGRGYVLRRLIRRAIRQGRKLGIRDAFLTKLADHVIEGSRDGYPELEEKREFIMNNIALEEERFEKTIDQGLEILSGMQEKLRAEGKTVLSGDDAFLLYDTYGFPIDSTKDVLEENGLSVDEEGFEAARAAAREKSKGTWIKTSMSGAAATVYDDMDPAVTTEFTGYNSLTDDSEILYLVRLDEAEGDEITDAVTDGMKAAVITGKTPFYGTMGGQVGDRGTIETASGAMIVDRTEHVSGGKTAHIGRVIRGMLQKGEMAHLSVDSAERTDTCRNHSATHLMQKALREVLGTHVEQKGSYQDDERTRFDFSHYQAMTAEEIARVEDLVSRKISEGLAVDTAVMGIEEAKKSGAMALFGEKYGDEVRVVKMGDFSVELCGGTHVKNTGEIGAFKILSESGVAAGVRRIEAITGDHVRAYYRGLEEQLAEIAGALRTNPAGILEHVKKLQTELKETRSENESLKSKMAQSSLGDVTQSAADVNGFKVLCTRVEGADMNGLRELGDTLREKLGESVIVLASVQDGRVNLMAAATEGAVKAGAHAGNLIKAVAGLVGGGGGGRPNMAQAGGKDPAGVDAALAKAAEVAKTQLGA